MLGGDFDDHRKGAFDGQFRVVVFERVLGGEFDHPSFVGYFAVTIEKTGVLLDLAQEFSISAGRGQEGIGWDLEARFGSRARDVRKLDGGQASCPVGQVEVDFAVGDPGHGIGWEFDDRQHGAFGQEVIEVVFRVAQQFERHGRILNRRGRRRAFGVRFGYFGTEDRQEQVRTDAVRCGDLDIDVSVVVLVACDLFVVVFEQAGILHDRKTFGQSDLEDLSGDQGELFGVDPLVAGDQVGLFDTEVIPGDKEIRARLGVVSWGAIPAGDFGGELACAVAEQFEAPMGVFVGDLAGDRLERETFFELFDAGHDPFDLSIAVQVRAADAHCSAVLHLFDRSAQVDILLDRSAGMSWVIEFEPVAVGFERDVRDERGHQNDGRAFAHPRFDFATAFELAIGWTADDQVAKKDLGVALDRRGLETGLESPAEGIVPLSEGDCGSVQIDRRAIALEFSDRVQGGRESEVPARESQDHGQLHLADDRRSIGDALLIDLGVEGKDPHRPAELHIASESIAGFGARIGSEEGKPAGVRKIRWTRTCRLADIVVEPFVQQERVDQHAPSQRACDVLGFVA